jgi:hypothetical protein
MMKKVEEVIKRVINESSRTHELSISRLARILFLIDWRASMTKHKPITNLTWQFQYPGIYGLELFDEIVNSASLKIENNLEGKKIVCIKDCDEDYPSSLSVHELEAIRFILEITNDLGWEDLDALTNATYPSYNSKFYKPLDLVKLANQYRLFLDNESKRFNKTRDKIHV